LRDVIGTQLTTDQRAAETSNQLQQKCWSFRTRACRDSQSLHSARKSSARCPRQFRPNVSPLFAIRRCRRTGTFLRGGSFYLRTFAKYSSSEQLPECNGSSRRRL